VNYGNEDYGGVSNGAALESDGAFAHRLLRRARRDHSMVGHSGVSDSGVAASNIEEAEAERMRERMYWGLTTMWEGALADEAMRRRR